MDRSAVQTRGGMKQSGDLCQRQEMIRGVSARSGGIAIPRESRNEAPSGPMQGHPKLGADTRRSTCGLIGAEAVSS
jgi:hypothetical protein